MVYIYSQNIPAGWNSTSITRLGDEQPAIEHPVDLLTLVSGG
jgi:hypothetical protein